MRRCSAECSSTTRSASTASRAEEESKETRGRAGLRRLEVELHVVANGPIADLGVDRVRGRIREIRIEATEVAPRFQKYVAERCDGGRRVARAPKLRRGINRVEGAARACLA